MSGKLILIVEDNEKNMKLIRDLLQVKGYETVESETAEEGLRLAAKHKPALILMDIQLPGMNGIEALKHLRADPGTMSIPVFAVTASAMSQDQAECMAAGFNGYQKKPLEIKEFLEAVRQVIEKGSTEG